MQGDTGFWTLLKNSNSTLIPSKNRSWPLLPPPNPRAQLLARASRQCDCPHGVARGRVCTPTSEGSARRSPRYLHSAPDRQGRFRSGDHDQRQSPACADHRLMCGAISHYDIIRRMNSAHQKTLAAIYSVPTPSSLEWRKIEALFVALGAEVVEGDGSRVAVVLNGKRADFHRPHPGKEAKRYQVRDAGEFLKSAGAKP